MSPEVFAQLIYNNYLFDIPKMFDLCVLYKKNEILAKIIENLFTTQKKYFDDFKICVKDIIKVINSINLKKKFN
jgi:activating signal cointegrator complex subunit 2